MGYRPPTPPPNPECSGIITTDSMLVYEWAPDGEFMEYIKPLPGKSGRHKRVGFANVAGIECLLSPDGMEIDTGHYRFRVVGRTPLMYVGELING